MPARKSIGNHAHDAPASWEDAAEEGPPPGGARDAEEESPPRRWAAELDASTGDAGGTTVL